MWLRVPANELFPQFQSRVFDLLVCFGDRNVGRHQRRLSGILILLSRPIPRLFDNLRVRLIAATATGRAVQPLVDASMMDGSTE
jgi:hypothetical protein